MNISYTSRFLRSFKKLSPQLQEDGYKGIDLFKNKNNHSKLSLHKLKGKLAKKYSFSINYSHRVILEISDDNAIFLDIGDHSMYENFS